MIATPVQCRILVRTNVDWTAMTPERFRAQDDPLQPQLFIHAAVKHDLPGIFSRTLGVDYFRYRAELQRIGRSSLETVRDTVISVGFDDFESWFDDDNEEFIFPIDDDDLFAPDLAQAVAGIPRETAIVMWRHVMAGYPEFTPEAAVQQRNEKILFSNNWGVRKSFLKENFSPERAKVFLARHMTAHEEMLRFLNLVPADEKLTGARRFTELEHPRVQVQPASRSVDYMHPGSLQFFGRLAQNGVPEQAMRAYSANADLSIPDYVSWAKPYLEALWSTCSRLAK